MSGALAGCGQSRAPGVVLAPSAGLTQAPANTSTTSTTPLPAALNSRPHVTVPTGPPPKDLKVIDLIKGTGPLATSTSSVTVQYVGVLYHNGRQFQSSWADGGQPVTFSLAHVIPGWRLGIPGMRVGGRRELIIPAFLAYGAKGRPPLIPPHAALVFIIDLHAVA